MRLVTIVSWAILAVVVDVSLARVAFGALVPSLRSGLGLDLAAAGTVSAANAIGYLITSALAPWFGRHVGMRRLAVGSHLLAAGAFVGVALSPSLVPLVLMRFLSGAGGGVGMVAALRLALDAAAPGRRLLVSTLAWSGAGLGLIVAAIGQPWLSAPNSWRGASVLCAALALVVAVSAPAHTTPNDHESAVNDALTTTVWRWQGSALVLGAYWCFGFGFLAYTTFAAVAPTHATPILRFLSVGVASVIGSLLAVRFRHAELGMAVALSLGTLGGAMTVLAYPLGDVLFGLGLSAVPGLATAVFRHRAGTAAATHAIAVSTIAVGAGQFVGPIVAGAAAQHFGIAWAPGVAGGAYLLGVVLIGADRWR